MINAKRKQAIDYKIKRKELSRVRVYLDVFEKDIKEKCFETNKIKSKTKKNNRFKTLRSQEKHIRWLMNVNVRLAIYLKIIKKHKNEKEKMPLTLSKLKPTSKRKKKKRQNKLQIWFKLKQQMEQIKRNEKYSDVMCSKYMTLDLRYILECKRI